ncbi:hypothetical protein P175DRAFT_0342248 [Aspergillus ochraceoroseus IBT 24754]|uniref:Uncharacterized protein n=1 Tax=Aspergillus ochraceoroseus IBT 24754 TaxID=1392256 RepID=A0A2T5LRU8_9EURO|nr:uncharacterized protein P175DRAFT_0342248 [Aspergillus ochraceoroseus IBT 24754]PTU19009.1 hypothetical protein P175DRAFT_0342248 [Aspergillus ochraceoroseus IBT 24754]
MTVVASAITTTFIPPANEVSVVGYYPSGNNEVGTIVCGSEYEFLVSSTYGICCMTASRGNCGFRQTCSASMMVYENGERVTCANDNPCVSTTIYQMSPSGGWSATMACKVNASNRG